MAFPIIARISFFEKEGKEVESIAWKKSTKTPVLLLISRFSPSIETPIFTFSTKHSHLHLIHLIIFTHISLLCIINCDYYNVNMVLIMSASISVNNAENELIKIVFVSAVVTGAFAGAAMGIVEASQIKTNNYAEAFFYRLAGGVFGAVMGGGVCGPTMVGIGVVTVRPLVSFAEAFFDQLTGRVS